jgi:magnesium chelatase family protein
LACRLGLSARAARRVLKLARTLADLAGEARVGAEAVAAAIGFRGDPETRDRGPRRAG